jgi:hypothetical protein
MEAKAKATTRESELKILGSCSRCGIALSKSQGFHFVPFDKKARWEYPAMESKEFPLPWKRAVGVLCDTCFTAGLPPHFAVELRPGTFIQYTKVELQDTFIPDAELINFVCSLQKPFHWSSAPERIKNAVKAFLAGEDISEADLSLIQWYVWQWGLNRNVPEDFKEKVAHSDLADFRRYVEKELRSKRGLDPFAD